MRSILLAGSLICLAAFAAPALAEAAADEAAIAPELAIAAAEEPAPQPAETASALADATACSTEPQALGGGGFKQLVRHLLHADVGSAGRGWRQRVRRLQLPGDPGDRRLHLRQQPLGVQLGLPARLTHPG